MGGLERVAKAAVRFVGVTFCGLLFSVLARMLDDSVTRWMTGAAIWGAALALAMTDAWFRHRREARRS